MGQNQSNSTELKLQKLGAFIKRNPDFQKSAFLNSYCDENNYFIMNGTPMNRAIYNLIICKRDLSLYHKTNMMPHKNWRITDVKNYFGLKGKIKALLPIYLELCAIFLDSEQTLMDAGKKILEDEK